MFLHVLSWAVRFSIAALCLLVSTVSFADDNLDANERRVLLLYSYHPTFPTSPKVLEGLLSGLNSREVVVEVEYMDSKRQYNSASVQAYKKYLQHKLKSRARYDVVVTADDNALNFMLAYGETLFPGTPYVFLGLNNLKLAHEVESNPMVTGVIEAASIKETIELAANLLSELKTLYLIADATPSGHSDLLTTLALKSNFPDIRFETINMKDLSWEELQSKLQSIPSNQAILMLSAYRDRNEMSMSFEKAFELIAAYANTPIFHPYEHGMGDGVFGGVIISHREQGRQAAIKVNQILDGISVRNIPILDKSPNIMVVDKRQLDRFKISLSKLPQMTEVRYDEKSVFARYWEEILVLTIIMLLMLMIIVILAQQNRMKAKLTRSLSESEQQMRTILDNIDAYIYLKSKDGKYLFVNRLMSVLFGISARDVVSKTDDELFDEQAAQHREAVDKEVMSLKRLYREDEVQWHPHHSAYREMQSTKIPLINEESETYALCGVSVDITDQKAHERQLRKIAHFDQLTELPNRTLFSDRLKQAMKNAFRQKKNISVLYMDLDGFKEVNDTYGHQFGDKLLIETAGRLKKLIRSNDIAARLGGDEFIVLLVNTGRPEDDLEITHKILDVISEPAVIDGIEVSVSASIGITRYPQPEVIEADQLLRQADQAMYIAKHLGKNRYHFFNSDLEEKAVNQERMYIEIARALKFDEFRLFYQPKINLETGAVVGLEALIRWQHPQQGTLPPAAFLDVVERHSLMIDIDDWVVNEALRQIDEWRQQGREIPVSVNVSHMYFKQNNLLQVLTDELAVYPEVSASLLELEVIETQALDNLKLVASTMRECQQLGVKFSLDDFGTGFSSLTYLKQLPIDMLKVDKSFVIDMLIDEEDRSILEGIQALAQAFDINTIAEGLETLEHGIELKKMGYHYAQGYGIAKPMPAEDIMDWIEQWKPPSEWC